MKQQTIICFATVVGLAACGSLSTYYKPGASVEVLNRQTLTCETTALREVPPSTQIRRTPPQLIRGKQTCNANGVCFTTPDRYLPGEIITYDPNDGLRRRVEQQCMADAGFTPVSIPSCPDAVARAASGEPTKILPNLNENSCVIRRKDGTFQIVTRG